MTLAGAAASEPMHGIAMSGAPDLPAAFEHFPYVNPEAPQGGRIVFGEQGGFDSLHPFIRAGSAPYGLQVYGYQSLMARSWDEPFTLYGLIAETVETDPERSWVEFTLREEARFSDGSPITVEDVIWSLETLGTEGHPRYLSAWRLVERVEPVGERGVRITFTEPNREMPLLMGLRPILSKADFEGRDFAESGLRAPLGSGPYVVGDFEPGRYISLVRTPDWWADDLPAMRGQHNLAEIRYDYFLDGSVLVEAFRAGEISFMREGNAQRWATEYDIPGVRDGRLVLTEIPHQRPSGLPGFVMNTRTDLFADWRVRQAMIELFNFEFINQTVNNGLLPRATSPFSNSVLGMQPGAAEGRVAALLAPFAGDLPPGALEGYALPVAPDARNRAGLRAARRLLSEAGWEIEGGRLMKDGAPFAFEILVRRAPNEALANLWRDSLAAVGMDVRIALVDDAQFLSRRDSYDFDVIYNFYAMSLSPGTEQRLYWGSAGRETEGTRNYAGVASPAVDAMIEALVTAETEETFLAAARALDRAIAAGRYVVPIWYQDVSRLAHAAELKRPATPPIYGDWIGYLPDVWWVEE